MHWCIVFCNRQIAVMNYRYFDASKVLKDKRFSNKYLALKLS